MKLLFITFLFRKYKILESCSTREGWSICRKFNRKFSSDLYIVGSVVSFFHFIAWNFFNDSWKEKIDSSGRIQETKCDIELGSSTSTYLTRHRFSYDIPVRSFSYFQFNNPSRISINIHLSNISSNEAFNSTPPSTTTLRITKSSYLISLNQFLIRYL